YGDWRSLGIDILREVRPGLHAWVTSTSWAKMDVLFVNEIRNNIYCAKVNAIIPWAAIQRPGIWVGGDPNPGCAFRVYDDGHYDVMQGYYYYKQVCRAGQPGMMVARVISNDSGIGLIAFAGNGTGNPDTFAVMNMREDAVPLNIQVLGTESTIFTVTRTGPGEHYIPLGDMVCSQGYISYLPPAGSVTTFTGQ
ncbi:MAG: hypothetical protein P1S60_12160, partial [Anaerolineae bacterium]|nr:hypothetical protein [Anaerolineae bacterium]